MSYQDEIGFPEIPERNTPPTNGSFTLKAKTAIYEVSLPQLRSLFVRELGVPEDRITITAKFRIHEDGIDSRLDHEVFDGLNITVKG